MTAARARYEIRVEGYLGEDWSALFGGLPVASGGTEQAGWPPPRRG